MFNMQWKNARIASAWAVSLFAGIAFAGPVFAQDPPLTLWDADATPVLIDAEDNAAVELGLRFRSSVSGWITGVRFYKSAANTGPHVGHLWSNGGALLAQADFVNETVSGWQTASFSAPVAINANTTYVVSYHAPAGRYAVNFDYFTGSHSRGPLTALADGAAGGNGLYRYGAAGFPGASWRSANYWVDVQFEPAGPDTQAPSVPAQLQASATGDTRLTVFWNASSDDTGVDHYDIVRDGVALAQTAATYHHDTTAQIGSTYTYRVRAVDAAGNRSDFSAPLTATFQPDPNQPGPVLPGTVGYRGEESALKLVDGPLDGNRNIPPPGCSWYAPEQSIHCRGDVSIEGYLIRGGVDHYGGGTLTVRNSVIEGKSNYQGIWLRKGSACGVAKISDTTLRWGGAQPTPQGNGAITDSEGCGVDLRRNDISGWSDGIHLSAGGIVEDNDIHDLETRPPPQHPQEGRHNDGIQFFGGSGYRVTGNSIRIGWAGPGGPQNAAIFLGGSSGVTIDPVFKHNHLSGGGFILRSNVARGVVFTDNIFEPTPQQFGDYHITAGTIRLWENNRHSDGSPVNYP